jgi:hypothetical protein
MEAVAATVRLVRAVCKKADRDTEPQSFGGCDDDDVEVPKSWKSIVAGRSLRSKL